MHCLLELVTKAISLFVTWMEDAIQGPHCYLGSKVTYVGQRTNVDITFNLLLCHFLANFDSDCSDCKARGGLPSCNFYSKMCKSIIMQIYAKSQKRYFSILQLILIYFVLSDRAWWPGFWPYPTAGGGGWRRVVFHGITLLFYGRFDCRKISQQPGGYTSIVWPWILYYF